MARDSIDIGITFQPTGLETFDKIRQELIGVAQVAKLSYKQFQQFIAAFDNAIRSGYSFVGALNLAKQTLRSQEKSVLEFQDVLVSLADTYRNMSYEELQRYKLGLKIQNTFLGGLLRFASVYAANTAAIKEFLTLFSRYIGGLGVVIASMLTIEEVAAKLWSTLSEGMELAVRFNALLGPLQKNISGLTAVYVDLGASAAATSQDVQQLLEGFERVPLAVASARKELVNIGTQIIKISKALDVNVQSMSKLVAQMIVFQWQGKVTSQRIQELGEQLAKLPIPVRDAVNILTEYIHVFSYLGVNVEKVLPSLGQLDLIMRSVGGSAQDFLQIGEQLTGVFMPEFAESLRKVTVLMHLMNQYLEVPATMGEVIQMVQASMEDIDRLTDMMYALGQSLAYSRENMYLAMRELPHMRRQFMYLAVAGRFSREEFKRQIEVMRQQDELNKKIANFYAQIGPIITRFWSSILRILKPLLPVLEAIAKGFEFIADVIDKISKNKIVKIFIETGFVYMSLKVLTKFLQWIWSILKAIGKYIAVRGATAAGGRAAARLGIGQGIARVLGLTNVWGWIISAAIVILPYVWDWLQKKDNSNTGNRRQESMSDKRTTLDMYHKLGLYPTPF